MTQLLISVKNSEEALIALATGVDIIDLKDPNEGALGALNLTMTKQILQLVNGRSLVSATAGELHVSIDALVLDIQLRADIGVDIIKIAVSDLFSQSGFLDAIAHLSTANIKIVAVFFADEDIDFNLLPALKNAGFYGAMLDTKNKQRNLLQLQHPSALHLFVQQCHKYKLISGLAGSLQPQHIDTLMEINATYLGFRGGICKDSQRKSSLVSSKVIEVKNMLRNDNRNRTKVQLILTSVA